MEQHKENKNEEVMSMWEESVTAPPFFAHRLSYCELLDENMVKDNVFNSDFYIMDGVLE